MLTFLRLHEEKVNFWASKLQTPGKVDNPSFPLFPKRLNNRRKKVSLHSEISKGCKKFKASSSLEASSLFLKFVEGENIFPG